MAVLPRRLLGRTGATAALLVALLASTLVACSSNGSDEPTVSAVPTPLSTKGSNVDLLCGIVPRASVEMALGRSDFTVSGELTPAAAPNPDGTTFKSGHCAVMLPGEDPNGRVAFSVDIKPVALTDLDIVKNARSGASDFSYPPDIAVGFASRDGFTDSHGTQHNTCESGLLRGDWTITLGIETPGAGRNPLDDTVALAQEIIDVLKLPLKPSEPYPPEFSAAASSGATPAPASS